jgi:hypothetical protein
VLEEEAWRHAYWTPELAEREKAKLSRYPREGHFGVYMTPGLAKAPFAMSPAILLYKPK